MIRTRFKIDGEEYSAERIEGVDGAYVEITDGAGRHCESVLAGDGNVIGAINGFTARVVDGTIASLSEAQKETSKAYIQQKNKPNG